MVRESSIERLKGVAEFFDRSTSCLAEEDSGFAPAKEMFTVAQLVAHVAQTIDWFMAGAFSPAGFDLDFEKHMPPVMACSSLGAARQWFAKAVEGAIELLGSKSDAELLQPLAEGPVMGGAPRVEVFAAISDHTAHHRGALTVYSRLLGKIPKMPYGDM